LIQKNQAMDALELGSDMSQKNRHDLRVYLRHDQGGKVPVLRTSDCQGVNEFPDCLLGDNWPFPDRSPASTMTVVDTPETGLVLKKHLYPGADGELLDRLPDNQRDFFLNATCSSGLACG
jgi:hypothetical protein